MFLMVNTRAFKWFLFDLKSSTPEIPVLLILTNQRLTFLPLPLPLILVTLPFHSPHCGWE